LYNIKNGSPENWKGETQTLINNINTLNSEINKFEEDVKNSKRSSRALSELLYNVDKVWDSNDPRAANARLSVFGENLGGHTRSQHSGIFDWIEDNVSAAVEGLGNIANSLFYYLPGKVMPEWMGGTKDGEFTRNAIRTLPEGMRDFDFAFTSAKDMNFE